MGALSLLAGLFGLPWMCAGTVRTVSHLGSLSVLTRTEAPGVKPRLDHIKDQRMTNFTVSLLIGKFVFSFTTYCAHLSEYFYFYFFCSLTFHCYQGTSPVYLQELVHKYIPSRNLLSKIPSNPVTKSYRSWSLQVYCS